MWNSDGEVSGGGFGYMTPSVGAGFGESPTSTQRQGEQSADLFQKSRRFLNVVPTCVGGIIRGLQSDDSVRIAGEKVGMVVIVGLITSVEVQSTVVTFKIDDTTGPPIVVKQWLDQHGRPQKDVSELMTPLVENCYVKVTGSVRTTNGEVYLVAHNVTSLSHLNELTCHLLEMAVVKTMLEQGIKSSLPSGGISVTQQLDKTSFGNRSGFGAAAVATPGSSDTVSGLTPQQQTVFQAIRSYEDENGCSVEFLMNHVKGISQDVIRKTVTLLSDEGHIYSTIDDDHYKATDN